ncbi:MAG: hypothetical protein LBT03_01550 [Holosporales bacterium]|jgi:hypothetical protein|nr:hypothetical protein [Holosporales bacterium]
MDKLLEQYFKELEKYSDLNNPDNDMPFSDIVDKIVLTKNPEAIPLLLKFCDDDMRCEYTSESLVSQIEYFEIEDYVPALLTELKSMFVKASQYCKYFFYTIFNTPDCLNCLKQNIHLADKETLLKLLDNIESDKYRPDERRPIITELRGLVNK